MSDSNKISQANLPDAVKDVVSVSKISEIPRKIYEQCERTK
jgi:hypothetical protein